MIVRVLGLSQRNVNSIMTSRHDVEMLRIDATSDEIAALLIKNPHTRVVIKGLADDDELLRGACDRPAASAFTTGYAGSACADQTAAGFPEQLSLLKALEQFRQAQTHFAFVADEFGYVEGW